MLLSPINIQSHVWNDTKCSKNFLNCFMICNVISEIMESVIKQYDKKWDNETNWVWNLSRWVIFCFVLSLVPVYRWWDEMMVENPVPDSSHIIHMIHNLSSFTNQMVKVGKQIINWVIGSKSKTAASESTSRGKMLVLVTCQPQITNNQAKSKSISATECKLSGRKCQKMKKKAIKYKWFYCRVITCDAHLWFWVRINFSSTQG